MSDEGKPVDYEGIENAALVEAAVFALLHEWGEEIGRRRVAKRVGTAAYILGLRTGDREGARRLADSMAKRAWAMLKKDGDDLAEMLSAIDDLEDHA